MSGISEELLRYKLPSEFRPGTDKISKLLLCDRAILNQVTKAVVGAPEDAYVCSSTSFTDGGICGVLYTPSAYIFSKFPPIMVEVQHTVNESFMSRAVRHCLNVYQQYKEYPILLIFCTKNISSKSLASKFVRHPEFPYCLQTPCDHFAKDVILATYDSIQEELDNDELLPIPAIANFFASGERSIVSISTMEDPMTMQLYGTAMNIVGHSEPHDTANESKLSALRSICGTLENQFVKVTNSIDTDPTRAAKYAKNGQAYCARLKRKYDDMAADGSVTPLEDPEEVQITALDRLPSKNDDLSTGDWDFVETFKKNNPGRMNWPMCFHAGRAGGYFTKYFNYNSLKVNYHKTKPSALLDKYDSF